MKTAIKHITAAALLFAFILGVPASVTAQKKAAAAQNFGNVNAITAQQMSDWLTFIASDELEGQANSGAKKFTVKPYVFENSKGEKVDAELGSLKVPENRKTPNGKQIDLAFVRFKKTGTGVGTPTIYLAGGPGGSGIGAARGTRFPLFMAMREFGDVIAFDQRGTGQSTPSLVCKGRFDFPADKAGERSEMIKRVSEHARNCGDQLRSQGIDLSAYNTEESADDIDDLRIALGAKKLNLWGISYGTHLALAVIKRHPSNVERAVMAGVNGLDDRRKLPSDAEETLVAISNTAKSDAELAAIVPDLHSLIRSVLADLDKGTVTAEIVNSQTKQTEKIGISKLDVQFLTAQSLGNARFIRSMPALYYAMSKGDYKETAQMLAGMKRSGLPGSAMFFSMDCASGGSRERYARIRREEGKTLLGNAFNFLIADSCQSWSVKDLGSEYRKPVISKVPVLFISGTFDGRTPPSRAEDVRKGFRNSSHLIIEGASHDDDLFLSTPVIRETILSFMNGGKLVETKTVSVEPPLVFRKPTPFSATRN